MRGLANKRVMVTGGASGIGFATARRFFEEGAQICVVDRPALEDTELSEYLPERLTYIRGDLSQPECLEAIDAHLDEVGIDVLVNNAGATIGASSVVSLEDLRRPTPSGSITGAWATIDGIWFYRPICPVSSSAAGPSHPRC